MHAGAENLASVVEQVARRCTWHRGHRHCRHYDSGPGINLYLGDGGRRDRGWRGDRGGKSYGYRSGGGQRGDRGGNRD